MTTKLRIYATDYRLRNDRAVALGYKNYPEERRRYKSISDSLAYKDLTPEQYKLATRLLRQADVELVKQRNVPGGDRRIPANIYGDFKKFLPVSDMSSLFKPSDFHGWRNGYYDD